MLVGELMDYISMVDYNGSRFFKKFLAYALACSVD